MSTSIVALIDGPSWGLPLAIAVFGAWLWSVVTVARHKTEDPYDRIVWLLVVLVLNIVGTILYLMFGPQRSKVGERDSEADIKRRANEGRL